MDYIETSTIELKEQYSDTFLKTVCAFANQDGGKIIFGVTDDGKLVGIKDLNIVYPKIERKIFDSITPMPYFDMEIDHKLLIIKVFVEAGDDKPYFYKNKVYIRRNTSTIEADLVTKKKLIMESKGIHFENQTIKSNNLTFKTLNTYLKKSIGIKSATNDFLKTAGLLTSDEKFNNAALLFSDQNDFSGIDTVKYNEHTERFTYRKNFSYCSVLEQVKKATEVFEDICSYEIIEGLNRVKHYSVPIKAFREALINAVIHRDWEIRSNVKITFFDDRVEILSPGTLPKDISENEFLNCFVSVPRNYIICSLFRRLGFIERMGYGISMIKRAYREESVKPKFEFLDNFVNVILPVVNENYKLSTDMEKILDLLKRSTPLSSSEIAGLVTMSKTKVVSLCGSMLKMGLINKSGNGRGTKYYIER
ncbi:MAG: putative DNA binding domain-containing protein [Coriobacteriia bacterium]|nr:putative DNA binding domain-containing protein [Coriobacteriia bacterium]